MSGVRYSPVLFPRIVFPAAPWWAAEARVSGPPPWDHSVVKLHLAPLPAWARPVPKLHHILVVVPLARMFLCLNPTWTSSVQVGLRPSKHRRTGRTPKLQSADGSVSLWSSELVIYVCNHVMDIGCMLICENQSVVLMYQCMFGLFCVCVDGSNFLELAWWSYSCCEELRLLPRLPLPTTNALILVILGWTWDVLF